MDERAPEGSIAFQGLRPYVIGDDLRLVHWRTTARTGTLMVKKNVDTNRPQVVVLLDDRRTSYTEAGWFEEAAETAASLVEAALRTGAPVRLDWSAGLRGFVPTGARDCLDLARRRGAVRGHGGDLGAAVNNLEQRDGRQRRGAGERRGHHRRRARPRQPRRPLPAGRASCSWAPGPPGPAGRQPRGVPGAGGAGRAGPVAVGDEDVSQPPWRGRAR